MEEKILDLASKLEQLVIAAAPKAWEVALTLVQLEALQNLLVGLFSLLVVFFAVKYCIRFGLAYREIVIEKGERYRNDEETKYIPLQLFSGAAGGIGTIVALSHLLDIWLYVALFTPELYLAKQAFDKIF